MDRPCEENLQIVVYYVSRMIIGQQVFQQSANHNKLGKHLRNVATIAHSCSLTQSHIAFVDQEELYCWRIRPETGSLSSIFMFLELSQDQAAKI